MLTEKRSSMLHGVLLIALFACAGNAMGETFAPVAIIVKMIRVMLLVPVLLILAYWIAMKARRSGGTAGVNISTPWFALMVLAVIGFNSFNLLPLALVDGINSSDTFLLTMAKYLAPVLL